MELQFCRPYRIMYFGNALVEWTVFCYIFMFLTGIAEAEGMISKDAYRA